MPECPNCSYGEMEKGHVIAGIQIWECPTCGYKGAPHPFNSFNKYNNNEQYYRETLLKQRNQRDEGEEAH